MSHTPDPAARLAEEARKIADDWVGDNTEVDALIIAAAKKYAAAESQRVREAAAACAAMREALDHERICRALGVEPSTDGDTEKHARRLLTELEARRVLDRHHAVDCPKWDEYEANPEDCTCGLSARQEKARRTIEGMK